MWYFDVFRVSDLLNTISCDFIFQLTIYREFYSIVNTGYSGSASFSPEPCALWILISMQFFIPTIIQQLGYRAEEAQVRSIPIFAVATVCCITTAYLTDRMRHRYMFTMVGVMVASIGYILLLCQLNISVGVKYFALFLIVSGGYITQPVTLTWLQNNVSGHYKRSVAAAMQVGFGNCGGIVASNIYFQAEAPEYWTGYGVSLALVWICGAACTALFFGVRRENKKRDRGERDWRLDEPDVDNMGDDHPEFRFTT